MKALVGAFHQEKALVWAFSVIVQPVVEPMEHYTALLLTTRATAAQRRRDPLITMLNPYLFCSAGWPGGSSV